jgi:hypothetical protein
MRGDSWFDDDADHDSISENGKKKWKDESNILHVELNIPH